VVLRPEGNKNTALVKSLSPGIANGVSAAEKRPGMQFVITDHEAADNVEKMPGAIGAISLAVILSERRPLKALVLDGVDPTPANAATKAYPLYKSLFFVTGPKRSAATERFIAFVRSPAGRKILADHGHWVP
jgi:phosphate transport system substrate-binding protein